MLGGTNTNQNKQILVKVEARKVKARLEVIEITITTTIIIIITTIQHLQTKLLRSKVCGDRVGRLVAWSVGWLP